MGTLLGRTGCGRGRGGGGGGHRLRAPAPANSALATVVVRSGGSPIDWLDQHPQQLLLDRALAARRARKRAHDELAQELRRAVRTARTLEGKGAQAAKEIVELRRDVKNEENRAEAAAQKLVEARLKAEAWMMEYCRLNGTRIQHHSRQADG